MIKFIRDFYSFIKTGSIEAENKLTVRKFLVRAFILKLSFYVLLLVFSYLLFNFNYGNSDFLFKDKTLWIVFLNMIILAPILEELTCRLHTGLKLYQIIISLVGAVILFHNSWLILSFFVCYFFLLFLILKIGVRVNRSYIIYSSALIFGILHIDFYDFNWLENFGYTFFVVITRIFSGLLFTYVFYQKGILFSILFHIIWNMMPFISYLLRYFET